MINLVYISQIYYDYISHQFFISHLNDKPYIYISIIYIYIYHELERLLRPTSPPSLQRCSSSQQQKQQQPAVAAVMAEWKRCGVLNIYIYMCMCG